MKKILYSLLLLSVFSCSDLFDKKPNDAYPEEVILTAEGMDALLTGAYSLISDVNYYGLRLFLYEAMKGSEFFTRGSGGAAFSNEDAYSVSSRSNGNNRYMWQHIFLVIRNLTIIIENIDNMWVNENDLRRIKGQAYLLRGLCYFDLMRLFAYPPIFSIPGHSNYMDTCRWGLPILNDVEIGTNIRDHHLPRETAETTFAFIVDQFKRAEELLEGRVVGRNRANAATAKALLIRAYLYLEDWNKVIEEGEEWLSKYGQQYDMLPYNGYITTYHKPFNSESVFELEYTIGNNLGSNSLNYWARRPTYDEPGSERDGTPSSILGYSKLCLTFGRTTGTTRGYELLNSNPNDVRRYLICELAIPGHPDYKSIRKYVGNPNHAVHNVPVVRLPEIYLSLAEACAKAGNAAKALEYASVVTLARCNAPANLSHINNLYEERRRELIFEGHNFWDQFRTSSHMKGRQIIGYMDDATITFGNWEGTTSCQVVYPIPLHELNVNEKMRIQQNPGYAKWYLDLEDLD